MNKSNIIEVIIPVYNAPGELKECVDSIMLHTNEIPYQVIIINDCSPDPEVNVYLNTLNEIPQITILNNEVNLGFVGTVNRGMSLAKHDVVLLNSDTIVTDAWLSKLKEAAYSHPSVATVTPFTNNGTICSIPNFCEDNELPEGYTIDSFAAFVSKVSERKFPELPTAVGFCMYIKNSVIREVGLFDVETFGKGYCEENDFCCRVIEHGYKNILADHVFVYHKGSMSFQGAKVKLIEDNLKKLNKRYPYYEQAVHDFIHLDNPLKFLHQSINLRLAQDKYINNLKGNILFVLHNFFDQPYNHPIGGTEYHVKDLVEQLPEYNVYILVSGGKELVLKHFQNGVEQAKYRFGLTFPLTTTHFHHSEYEEAFERILNTFQIDIVHIHHLIKHSFDAPYVAKKLGIPVYFTLHDFYFFCPRVNLLDENHEYCLDKRSPNKCVACLQSSHKFHTHFLAKWKKEVISMMDQIDKFFVPSPSTKALFTEEFPFLEGNIEVVEHGFDWAGTDSLDNVVDDSGEIEKISIGFLGGLSPSKGSHLIYELISTNRDKRIEWHLIGGLGDQKLNLLQQSNVIKHGPYNRDNLNNILDRINLDLIALLSPWPETYSYTLSESWNHGIPVLVTPMGALKDRVNEVGGGWIIEGMDSKAISRAVDKLIKDFPRKKKEAQKKILSYSFKSKRDMAMIYKNYYETTTKANHEHQIRTPYYSNREILNAIRFFEPAQLETESEYNSYTQHLEHEITSIKSTIGYKVLERLRTRHKSSLKIGKKFIYYILKYKKR